MYIKFALLKIISKKFEKRNTYTQAKACFLVAAYSVDQIIRNEVYSKLYS